MDIRQLVNSTELEGEHAMRTPLTDCALRVHREEKNPKQSAWHVCGTHTLAAGTVGLH